MFGVFGAPDNPADAKVIAECIASHKGMKEEKEKK
jgi:hypothetical protein